MAQTLHATSKNRTMLAVVVVVRLSLFLPVVVVIVVVNTLKKAYIVEGQAIPLKPTSSPTVESCNPKPYIRRGQMSPKVLNPKP